MKEMPEIIWATLEPEWENWSGPLVGGEWGAKRHTPRDICYVRFTQYRALEKRVDALRAENERLREALGRIAAVKHPGEPHNPYKEMARAALARQTEGDG